MKGRSVGGWISLEKFSLFRAPFTTGGKLYCLLAHIESVQFMDGLNNSRIRTEVLGKRNH